MAGPVKILVLQLESIGDVVLTTPVVRCLKQQIQRPWCIFVRNGPTSPSLKPIRTLLSRLLPG